MSRTLSNVADVYYGKRQNEVVDDFGRYPIIGTGGVFGTARIPLFHGPAVVVGRKGTLDSPRYVASDFWTVDTAYAVLPKEGTHSKWLYYVLCASQLERLNESTGVPSINRDRLYAVPIRDVPYTEQARIAAVLDTVDEAIAKTEAVIAKLRQVRAGLLHDLLTRGLDENGHLRDPVAHPEQFQDSPLGRIPGSWIYKTLEEAADWFSGGTPSRSQPTWWTGDLPILTPKDMKVFEISDTIEHVTNEAAIVGSKVMPAETAFIVVRGMILAHTFPVCLSTRPLAFNQDIKAIRGRQGLKTRYLAHWFAANTSSFLRKTTEATHGTKKLDSKALLTTYIAIPQQEEQDLIVDRVETIDTEIIVEAGAVGKLNALKSGLMDDLLTGRVRVPEGVCCGG